MEQDVLATDARRIRAMIHADEEILRDLLADDLTYTHTNCVVDTKESLITKLRDGSYDYRVLETTDVCAKPVGSEAAVLTGAASMTIHAGDRDIVLPIRFTSVYVRENGGWKLTAWQSTHQP